MKGPQKAGPLRLQKLGALKANSHSCQLGLVVSNFHLRENVHVSPKKEKSKARFDLLLISNRDLG